MSLSLFEFVLLLLGLLVVVTGTRVVFLYLPSDWRPRGSLERALRYAPLCALVALVVPQVFAGFPGFPGFAGLNGLSGSSGGSAQNDFGLFALALAVFQDGRLPAALVALAVAALARQPLPGLVAGVVVLLLI